MRFEHGRLIDESIRVGHVGLLDQSLQNLTVDRHPVGRERRRPAASEAHQVLSEAGCDVGGMTIPLIRKFEAGYVAGVKAVCASCEVHSGYAGASPEAHDA